MNEVARIPALTGGSQVVAIVPRTFEETFRVARAVVASKLAPAALIGRRSDYITGLFGTFQFEYLQRALKFVGGDNGITFLTKRGTNDDHRHSSTLFTIGRDTFGMLMPLRPSDSAESCPIPFAPQLAAAAEG